jgi:hypothetical protein
MPNREFTPSSGNVFADLNLPHADDLPAKAELAAKIELFPTPGLPEWREKL